MLRGMASWKAGESMKSMKSAATSPAGVPWRMPANSIWRKQLPSLTTAAVGAEDRLAVLEFFGRTGCSNCQAAGAVISDLQDEYQGRALLLEYDVDYFRYGRQQRYLVADPDAARACEIAVLTVPYSAQGPTLTALHDMLQGKILVDVTVPLKPPHGRSWSLRATNIWRSYR